MNSPIVGALRKSSPGAAIGVMAKAAVASTHRAVSSTGKGGRDARHAGIATLVPVAFPSSVITPLLLGDMVGGKMVPMIDVSAPILIKGRHWGALRLAYTASK